MAGTLPEWALTPKSKGWYVQTVAENGERRDLVADDKPGLFIGRNGQVDVVFFLQIYHPTL